MELENVVGGSGAGREKSVIGLDAAGAAEKQTLVRAREAGERGREGAEIGETDKEGHGRRFPVGVLERAEGATSGHLRRWKECWCR